MATYRVHMLAFQPEYCLRHVVVPDGIEDTDQLREKIWEQGQNMFCNVPGICSLSAGDVMEIDGEYHLILGLGFAVITAEQLKAYKAIPQRDRSLITMRDAPEVLELLSKS